jgi:hypothetical protein
LPVTFRAEDSPRGLWRSLGKRVGCKPSRVRIPHPPPGGKRALTWKRRSIRSARDVVASHIKAASLSSGLSFRPPICAKLGPPTSRGVRRRAPRLINPLRKRGRGCPVIRPIRFRADVGDHAATDAFGVPPSNALILNIACESAQTRAGLDLVARHRWPPTTHVRSRIALNARIA